METPDTILNGKEIILSVFIYLKLWYAAHIMLFSRVFEKQLNRIKIIFLWDKGNSTVAIITMVRKSQLEDLCFISAAEHFRKIWSKLALTMLIT